MCTFVNANQDAPVCEMCQSQRAGSLHAEDNAPRSGDVKASTRTEVSEPAIATDGATAAEPEVEFSSARTITEGPDRGKKSIDLDDLLDF